jgi:predicted kinase
MFELAKSNGQNILFDATMLNSKARKPIVKLAKNCGFVVDCHYFVPNLDLVKERLKLRERQVPMEVILSQVSRWQEPSFDEGFDILFNLSKI